MVLHRDSCIKRFIELKRTNLCVNSIMMLAKMSLNLGNNND